MHNTIDLAKRGFFPPGSKVLNTDLGGAPAINGCAYTFGSGRCRRGSELLGSRERGKAAVHTAPLKEIGKQ